MPCKRQVACQVRDGRFPSPSDKKTPPLRHKISGQNLGSATTAQPASVRACASESSASGPLPSKKRIGWLAGWPADWPCTVGSGGCHGMHPHQRSPEQYRHFSSSSCHHQQVTSFPRLVDGIAPGRSQPLITQSFRNKNEKLLLAAVFSAVHIDLLLYVLSTTGSLHPDKLTQHPDQYLQAAKDDTI